MRPAPQSLSWLVAHDLRLARRRCGELFRRLTPAARRVLLVIAIAGVHGLAWPVARWIVMAEATGESRGLMLGGIAAALAFALTWMTAQALTSVTRTLYVRGDLDLLLAAPVAPDRVIAARALSISTECAASAGLFLLPIANDAALMGQPHWLGLYPVIGAGALFASAAGIVLSLGLFKLVGARRTRVASQVLATLIGAGVALAIQAAAVLPPDMRGAILERVESAAPTAAQISDELAWLPVRAASGEPVAIAVMLAAGIAAFIGVVRQLGAAFAHTVLVTAGTAVYRPMTRRRARMPRFETRIGPALRAKERRLLMRDPWIVWQLVLQIVYTVPVALVLWRSGVGGSVAVAATPSLAIIAAQVSGALAWIAISGEDAPEFMATAPVSRSTVEIQKLIVIAQCVAGLLALPIILLATVSLQACAIAVVICAAAATSGALINLWHPTDGRRRDFMRRHAQSKLIGLVEHLLSFLWAITGVLAQLGSLVALVPAVVVVVILYFTRHALVERPRQRADAAPMGASAVAGTA